MFSLRFHPRPTSRNEEIDKIWAASYGKIAIIFALPTANELQIAFPYFYTTVCHVSICIAKRVDLRSHNRLYQVRPCKAAAGLEIDFVINREVALQICQLA